jgi:hypothetical protein
VCVQVNKKYRKKLKKRYLFQLTYVPVRLRQRFFYKLLSKIMQQSDKRGFQNNDHVIVLWSGRIYKGKIIKGISTKTGWN